MNKYKVLAIFLGALLLGSFGVNGFMYWKLNKAINKRDKEIMAGYENINRIQLKLDSIKNAAITDTIYQIKNRIIKLKEIEKEVRYVRPNLEEAKKILGI